MTGKRIPLHTLVGVFLFAFIACSGVLGASEPVDEITALTRQLEGLKGEAEDLLDRVNLIGEAGDAAALPGLFAEALALEERALLIVQQGTDLAQTVADPSEPFKKVVIIFEVVHVKVVQVIVIVKLTILQFQEELEVPQGPREPEIDQIIALTGDLEALKNEGKQLIDSIRSVTSFDELPPLFAQALSVEEQALPILQQGIDIAQTVSNPTELLKKKIIIFEHFHIKVVHVITVAKLLILQLQEEFLDPDEPPDQGTIDQIIALTGDLEAIEGQADDLIAQIRLGLAPDEVPARLQEALALEQQALPIVQGGIDTAQDVPDPSELLVKKVIIFEVQTVLVVVEIDIIKLLILQFREEMGLDPGSPEPVIPEIIGLSNQLSALEDEAEELIQTARAVGAREELPPLFAQALDIEERALPSLQQGLDSAQAVADPSELLTKKIAILEVWFVEVVSEVTFAKLIILRLKQELPPGDPSDTSVAQGWSPGSRGVILGVILLPLLGGLAYILRRRNGARNGNG